MIIVVYRLINVLFKVSMNLNNVPAIEKPDWTEIR